MIEIPRPLAAVLGAAQPSRMTDTRPRDSGPLWPYFVAVLALAGLGMLF